MMKETELYGGSVEVDLSSGDFFMSSRVRLYDCEGDTLAGLRVPVIGLRKHHEFYIFSKGALDTIVKSADGLSTIMTVPSGDGAILRHMDGTWKWILRRANCLPFSRELLKQLEVLVNINLPNTTGTGSYVTKPVVDQLETLVNEEMPVTV